MLTGELRNKIDKLWTTFWTGGIANPLTGIEQFFYLFFIRLMVIMTEPSIKNSIFDFV